MINVEGFKAVSNHFSQFLEVAISNSYGGYTGLLQYQLGHPPRNNFGECDRWILKFEDALQGALQLTTGRIRSKQDQL
jgi:hypothetical protein